MKLKGISDKGFQRLARTIKSQETEEISDGGKGQEEFDLLKYGESRNWEYVKDRIFASNAEWTDEGWIIPFNLSLAKLGITRLPLFSQVGNYLSVSYNPLESLDGVPQDMVSLDCRYCGLTSLEGSPETADYMDCGFNKLMSLEGAPIKCRWFGCENNPGNFTDEDVLEVCDAEIIVTE